MKLTVISGLGEKLPACFLVEAGEKRLLLDLGAGPDAGVRPDLGKLGSGRPVDAILLSHAHPDHCAALDAWKELGSPPIFATDPVCAMVGHAGMRPLPLSGRIEICGMDIATGRSGHAPGGIWLHLAVGEGLLYAGDMDFTDGLYRRDDPPAAATAILDASYGLYDTTGMDAKATLAAMIGDASPVLLPVPAGGRGPDMALWLKRTTGDWPRIDSAVREIASRLAGNWSGCVRPELIPDLVALAAEAPAADRPEGIILAAKPNLTGGAAADLADPVLAAGGRIVFTGHVAKGTLAARLVREGRAAFARWPVHPRLSDNADLARRVGARRVLPAFGALDHAPAWKAAFDGIDLVLSDETPL